MKQPLFGSGHISGGVSGGGVETSIEWQGGDGWLTIGSFTQVSGTPSMSMTVLIGGIGSSPLPDIASPVVAPGVYPFYAPAGALISAAITVSAGDQVSFGSIDLFGDA